jgi:membrane dipeptidase
MPDTFPVFDGHNDALMYFSPPDNAPVSTFFERLDKRQLDMPRAKEGNFAGGFFAEEEQALDMVHNFDPTVEYILPAIEYAYAARVAMHQTASLFRIEVQSKGQFKVARSVADIEQCIRDGVVFGILHFEGAEPVDTDLNALEVYYRAGLRSLGIVWSRPTAFGYGVPFKFPADPDTGPGLTDAGKELVRECNRLGIMVDLSHLNEKGFWDVAKTSTAPLVATHSNAHVLCNLPRNLTDKQLAAVKESDGMVGVNFVVLLAREDGQNDPNTPLETIVRHVDYLVESLGVERVGFGSDFGVATVPNELADISMYPNLIAALRKAGYDDDTLRKITHENWIRVLRKTWK